MKTINKVVIGLLAAMALAWAQAAYAQDNGTEFGIEDDLTVLGKAGTAVDPDVEIKGFTVFGSTQTSYLIPVDTGNVVLNGVVQISSGLYSAGSSTFAARGAFQSTVAFNGNTGALTNLYFDNAAANSGKVLKASGNGFLTWGDDNTGAAGGTAYRVPMWNNTGGVFVNSPFLGDSDAPNNITMVFGSSMTILGDGTDGLGVAGATKLSGALSVVGAVATSLGGTLGVTGVATLSNDLNVAGAAALIGDITLGSDSADLLTVNAQSSFVGGSTFSATTGAYFLGISSFSDVSKVFYGGGGAGEVLSKVAGGGMTWTSPSALGAGDDLGNHIATMTVTANYGIVTTTITATDNVVLSSNTVMGGDIDDIDNNARLKVVGGTGSGNYAATFYSGGSLAAWIKKK